MRSQCGRRGGSPQASRIEENARSEDNPSDGEAGFTPAKTSYFLKENHQ
jgi:hypothetical protein